MTERNHPDLQDAFHALRREDAAAATPFHATLAAARARAAARPRRRTLGLAAAGIVVAGVALAVLFTRAHRHGVTIDLATVRWVAPSDFLLQLPGDSLLRSVPQLGFSTINSDRRIP